MPRCISAAPTFLVNDVGATARWYEEHLGFQAALVPHAAPYVYASLWRDSIEIMLLRMEGFKKTQIERTGGNWDAYIRMTGVHEFYETVRQTVPIRMALKQQPYNDWEFEVADPNGYVLVFSE
jgi:uncharacterized glyoxalase superfamily protein PhnB